jgi:hypothetical protein
LSYYLETLLHLGVYDTDNACQESSQYKSVREVHCKFLVEGWAMIIFPITLKNLAITQRISSK